MGEINCIGGGGEIKGAKIKGSENLRQAKFEGTKVVPNISGLPFGLFLITFSVMPDLLYFNKSSYFFFIQRTVLSFNEG